MKTDNQICLNRPTFNPVLFVLAIVASQFLGAAGFAQNVPLKQPVIDQPVPQYTPRYPLLESPQPRSNVSTPTPQHNPQLNPQLMAPENPNHQIQSVLGPEENQIPEPALASPPIQIDQSHAIGSARSAPAPRVDYSLYRDRRPYPIDPRKPCNECVRPHAVQSRGCELPGLKGRPYIDKEPGGCLCNKKRAPKHASSSVYWPRPFSTKLAGHSDETVTTCPKKRIVDIFDPLATFKLIPYQRRDNGYCGRGADPFGCLGESRHQSGVRGVNDQILREPLPPQFGY